MPIPLREHLEAKAHAERDRTNLLFAITLAAAAFVWAEIMRRLGVLNHAHETAQDVAKTTVRQDMYDQGKKEQDGRIEKVEKEQGSAAADRLGDDRGRRATLAVIGAVGAVVTVVVLLANGVI